MLDAVVVNVAPSDTPEMLDFRDTEVLVAVAVAMDEDIKECCVGFSPEELPLREPLPFE